MELQRVLPYVSPSRLVILRAVSRALLLLFLAS